MARKDDDPNDLADARSRNHLTPAWMAAAGIGLIVIAGLIVVLIWGRGNSSNAQPSGAGSVPVTAVPTPGTGQDVPAGWKPCSHVAQAASSVNGQEWEEFSKAPATTWRELDGQMLPTTAGGPFKYEQKDGGTLAECYTPDALGALTALAQIELRAYSKPSGRAVRLNQTMPGSTLQVPKALQAYARAKKPWVQLAGFKFLTPIQNNSTTIITQYMLPPDKYFDPTAWEVQWTGTDWKVGNAVHIYGDDTGASPPALIHWSQK